MERVGDKGTTFLWPTGAKGNCVYTHPLQDIICVISNPDVIMDGRSVRYSFDSTDIEKISRLTDDNAILM